MPEDNSQCWRKLNFIHILIPRSGTIVYLQLRQNSDNCIMRIRTAKAIDIGTLIKSLTIWLILNLLLSARDFVGGIPGLRVVEAGYSLSQNQQRVIQQGPAQIKAEEKWIFCGNTFIILMFDMSGGGIFVINSRFNVRWYMCSDTHYTRFNIFWQN